LLAGPPINTHTHTHRLVCPLQNPAYKGKWSAPFIDNPAYKGIWQPRDIPNPDYYKDDTPLAHIGKVGAAAIEIWTMDDGYFFDSVVVANSEAEAAAVRDASWAPKKAAEVRPCRLVGGGPFLVGSWELVELPGRLAGQLAVPP
jgi:hypothetical protein